MARGLKSDLQIWKLARDLRLPATSDPVTEIVAHCARWVGALAKEFNCKSLSELLEYAADRLGTVFREVRTDQELAEIKDQFLKRGEKEFALIDEELRPGVFAITFRLLKPRKGERQYVSIIDCRGDKTFRSYYSKWHELAHLLTLTDQYRLKFCRTHSALVKKDPEEALMEKIAGHIGYLPDLVHPYAKGPISFHKIDAIRATLCPESSVYASVIGMTANWPNACVLLEATLEYKKSERVKLKQPGLGFVSSPQPKLGNNILDSYRAKRAKYGARKFRLVSLLEMLELDASLFFMISAALEEERGKCANPPHSNPTTDEEKAGFLSTLDLISDTCYETDLHLSALYIKRLDSDIRSKNFTYQQIGEKLDVLQDRISDELESVKILYVSRHHADLYGDKPHFGDSVAAKFPKLTGDIQEAANCLALERTTACVFHLMRVMESAVQYLGKKLAISLVNEKNWANILDEVDKAIKALPTKSSRQKALRNKYAESSAHLRMVKDAWRNDVMHPKETYTGEEAERVFRNVKDFMVHLATRL